MNKDLNPNQQKAVNHIEGPLLVLAGAGSGKTRVVTMRIANLIDIGIPESDILAITFTNKAANEMKLRIEKLTKTKVSVSTFHSLGAKILRESIHHIDYKNDFLIYDKEDSIKLLKDCFKSLNLNEEKESLKSLKSSISNIKNNLISLNSPIITKCEKDIFSLYQKKLKAFNALDFDDLLYLTVVLFQKIPLVLEIYQKRWPFILIDEYQDTNFVQYTFAKLLSEKYKNICVVGDPDQSIYSFRGARYQNILNFDKDFPTAKVIHLENNYRSTSNILDAANSIIKNNSKRLDKKLVSQLGAGEKIKVFTAQSDSQEASFIAEKIITHTLKTDTPYNNIAIFYRTNFQSRIFEDTLLSYKIPYVIYGSLSFYQRKEVKDILAYLKLIISDSDFISFSRIINVPKRGLGKTTLSNLFYVSEEHDIPIITLIREYLETPTKFNLRLSKKQILNLQDFISKLDELRSYLNSMDLSDLMEETILKMRYLDHLKTDKETLNDRKENLNELIVKASSWQTENENDLKNFLSDLSLISSTDNKDENNSIKLMTLHNSKGLEFDLVFIAGLEEDLFPHINSKHSMEDIEEERRLFYVGMTRARKYLYLCSSFLRYMFGSQRISTPSRFLREIPKEYIENTSSNTDYEQESEFSHQVGDRVFHNTFGIGIVQKLYNTSLGETLDILFESTNSLKSLVSKYAKLKNYS